MHILAKRLLKEVVAPKVEMLLGDKGLSEMEMKNTYAMTCLAKELLECDVMLKKMGEYDSDASKAGTYPGAGGASSMNL